MEKFLETHKLPKLTQEEIENLNRPITSKEIELELKTSQQRRISLVNCTKHLKRSQRQSFSNSYQKMEKEGTLPTSFYEVSIILIPKPDKGTTRKETMG